MDNGRSRPRLKRLVLRVAAGLGAVVLIVAASLIVAVSARWERTFEAPPVSVHLRASTAPAVVERGRYLVNGPSHCVACHAMNPASVAPADESESGDYSEAGDNAATRAEKGNATPLAGGNKFHVLGATVRVPNITPDSVTGIGALTDEQLVRAIRYGVRRDGRAMLPFMQFQNLADDDLIAILSYLRSQEPVSHAVPKHAHSPLSKTVLAFLIEPRGPRETPRAHAPLGIDAERGEYLVRSVALCGDCHTQRNPMDGTAAGPELAGGAVMQDYSDPAFQFVTPNLTPDTATGRIALWNEDAFVARVKAGRVFTGSPMPWEAYSRMTDDDLRSIYRYLRTRAAVQNNTGLSRQQKEKKKGQPG